MHFLSILLLLSRVDPASLSERVLGVSPKRLGDRGMDTNEARQQQSRKNGQRGCIVSQTLILTSYVWSERPIAAPGVISPGRVEGTQIR